MTADGTKKLAKILHKELTLPLNTITSHLMSNSGILQTAEKLVNLCPELMRAVAAGGANGVDDVATPRDMAAYKFCDAIGERVKKGNADFKNLPFKYAGLVLKLCSDPRSQDLMDAVWGPLHAYLAHNNPLLDLSKPDSMGQIAKCCNGGEWCKGYIYIHIAHIVTTSYHFLLLPIASYCFARVSGSCPDALSTLRAATSRCLPPSPA